MVEAQIARVDRVYYYLASATQYERISTKTGTGPRAFRDIFRYLH